ncbi:YncE family protein [Kitasatospora sp. NPDC089797]|uniref:YncE family protein n=1 Tax=Kitasatospora sp. NPDC089797 TaxID=3155298 RepID=UPI003428D469
MSQHAPVAAARPAVRTAFRRTAVAAAVLLALTGTAATATAAAADAPLSGSEATIAVGARNAVPVVSPDGATAYVAVTEADNTSTVKAVDTQSGAVTARLALGTLQWGAHIVLSADGSRLYVLDGQRLSVVDTATLTLRATVALPDQPRPAGWTQGSTSGLAFSPDGSTLYVSQSGPTAYRQNGQSRILAFATAQQAFTASVQIPAPYVGAPAARPGTGDLYVGTSQGVVHLTTAGAAPAVAATVQGTATALDYNLAFTPDGKRLFGLAEIGSGTSTFIDPATDTVTGTFHAGAGAEALESPQVSADGTRIYLTDSTYTSSASVLALDTATGAPVPADGAGDLDEDNLTGLALGPDGHTFYVTGTVGQTANLQIVAH